MSAVIESCLRFAVYKRTQGKFLRIRDFSGRDQKWPKRVERLAAFPL